MSNDPIGEKPEDESMKCLLARLDGALEDDPNPLQPSRTAQQTAESAAAAALQAQNRVQNQVQNQAQYSAPNQMPNQMAAGQSTRTVEQIEAPALPEAQAATQNTGQPMQPMQPTMANDDAVLSAASSMHTSAVEPAQELTLATVPNPAEEVATAFEEARNAAVTSASTSASDFAVPFEASPTPEAVPSSPARHYSADQSGTAEISTAVSPSAMAAPTAPAAPTATSTTSTSPTAMSPGAAKRSHEHGEFDNSGRPNLQLVASTPVATQSTAVGISVSAPASAPMSIAAPLAAPKWYQNNTHVAIAAALGGVVICAPLILFLGYKMGGGDASVIGTASEKIEEQRQIDHALEARMTPAYGLGSALKKRRVMALLEDKEEGRQLALGNVSPQLLTQPRLVRGAADGAAEYRDQSIDHAAMSGSALSDPAAARSPTAAVASLGEPDRKPVAQSNNAAPTTPRTPAAVAMLEPPPVTAIPVPNGGEAPGNNAATTRAPTLVPPGDTLAKSASTAPAPQTPVSKTPAPQTLVSKTLELDLGLSKPAPADVAQSEVAAASTAPAKPKEEKLHLPLAVLKPELTGKAGDRIPLSLRFEPYALLPERSFVMISGLPDDVKLGGGVRRGPGIWLVNAPDVPDAVLELSKSGTGSFEIVANLIGPDGTEISNAKSRLIIEQFEKEASKVTLAPATTVQAGISLSPFTAPVKTPKTAQLQEIAPVEDRTASRLPSPSPNEAVARAVKSAAASIDGAASRSLTSSSATQNAPPASPRAGYATSDLMEPETSRPAPGTSSRALSSIASSGTSSSVTGSSASSSSAITSSASSFRDSSSSVTGPAMKPAARREDITEALQAPGITTGSIGTQAPQIGAGMIYSPSNLMSEIVKPKRKIPQQLASVLSKLANRPAGAAISMPAATLTTLAETTLASGVGISLAPSNPAFAASAMASSNLLAVGNQAAKGDRDSVSAATGSSALRGSETIIAMMQPQLDQTQQTKTARNPAGSSQLAQQRRSDEQPTLFIPQAEVHKLIERGQKRIAIGDISLARLLFERAANGGSAQAAFALAETYDPNLIWRLGAVGLTGDKQKARFWYLQAQKLDRRMQIGERLRALLGL